MKNNYLSNIEYLSFINELKSLYRESQIKAFVKVNRELLNFNWYLGKKIIEKQQFYNWGDGFITNLSKDLIREFPDAKGFSQRNLKSIRQWYLFYSHNIEIGQQNVAQLTNTNLPIQKNEILELITSIPWGHNLVIISKCKNIDEALYYLKNTLEFNWSRSVLTHQIESNLFKREGNAITNFEVTMPKPFSDLARQTLKDPYNFDFLELTKEHTEHDIETGLMDHITKFLLELGVGFAFVGRQFNIEVEGKDFFIDLLFYHLKLRSYIVIELKTIEFEPEHAGKLNFYLKAVDSILRHEQDQPSIGLIICKKKNKIIAEWALSGMSKPIGISEYLITLQIPEIYESSLPSIEEIENELTSIK